MTRRKVRLKGSHPFTRERRIKAAKLRGGPGRKGIKHPRKPATARMNPRVIREIVRNISIILEHHAPR
jgi:hypothetical protein